MDAVATSPQSIVASNGLFYLHQVLALLGNELVWAGMHAANVVNSLRVLA